MVRRLGETVRSATDIQDGDTNEQRARGCVEFIVFKKLRNEKRKTKLRTHRAAY
jgi:hypothetical protein